MSEKIYEIVSIKDLGIKDYKGEKFVIELNHEFPCDLLAETKYVIMLIIDLDIEDQKWNLGRIETMFFAGWKNGDILNYRSIHCDRDVTKEKAIDGFLEVMNW